MAIDVGLQVLKKHPSKCPNIAESLWIVDVEATYSSCDSLQISVRTFSISNDHRYVLCLLCQDCIFSNRTFRRVRVLRGIDLLEPRTSLIVTSVLSHIVLYLVNGDTSTYPSQLYKRQDFQRPHQIVGKAAVPQATENHCLRTSTRPRRSGFLSRRRSAR